MNCLRFEQIVHESSRRRLAAAELGEFDSHRRHCAMCQGLHDEHQQIREGLQQLFVDVHAPRGGWAYLSARLRNAGVTDGQPRLAPVIADDEAAVRPRLDSFSELYFQPDSPAPDSSPGAHGLEVFAIWSNSVIATLNLSQMGPVRIGETKRCQIFVPSDLLGRRSYQLFRGTMAKPLLNLSLPQLDGEILTTQGRVTLDELRQRGDVPTDGHFPLPRGSKCRLFLGPVTLVINYSPLERPAGATLRHHVDGAFFSTNVASIIAHAMLLVLVLILPHREFKLEEEPGTGSLAPFQVTLQRHRRDPQEELQMVVEKRKPTREGPKRMAVTAIEKKRAALGGGIDRGVRPDPKTRRRHKLIGTKNSRAYWQTDELASLYRKSPRGLRVGELRVHRIGARGPGGMQLRDGFMIEGVLDGNLSNRRPGQRMSSFVTCDSHPVSVKSCVLHFNRRTERLSYTRSGVLKVTVGSVPHQLVLRVLRKQHNAFRFCYQQELQRSPQLHGKVVIEFHIAKEGHVTFARSLNAPAPLRAVATCVGKRIGWLHFAGVNSSDGATVRYPIHFKSVEQPRR